jgi:Co/Zn/Cd efflux system component
VIFLHLVADSLVSVLVAGSGLLLGRRSLTVVEPLSSVLLGVLLAATVFPIWRSMGEILLQGRPAQANRLLEKCMKVSAGSGACCRRYS